MPKTQVKDRPILFSGAMVRAILEGRKTQTRRIVKPSQSKPKIPPLLMDPWEIDGEQEIDDDGNPLWAGSHPEYPTGVKYFGCPQGKVGDRLWVRETWRNAISDSHECYAYRSTMTYGCGKPMPEDFESTRSQSVGGEWKPSIFMPRAASRINLEIVGVKVERLQSIGEEDAIAEGIYQLSSGYWSGGIHKVKGTTKHMPSAVAGFEDLWDSINGKTMPWESNPWVWAIEFKRVEGSNDA